MSPGNLVYQVLCGLAVALTICSAASLAQAPAKTMVCAGCHGTDGNSLAGTFPRLAGQHEKYLMRQMHAIQSGERAAPLMANMLDGLSDADFAEIAAYYAAQEPGLGVADPDRVALGETIYRAGIADKGVAACSACHSPQGAGNGPAGYPRLSGQHVEYLVSTLKAYRSGERRTDGDLRIMRDVAGRLSDAEVEAVASYIAGLR